MDLIAEMRAAGLVGGSAALDLLRIATLGGANALGLGGLIGSIELGKAADLICVDLASSASPFTSPSTSSVAESLVYSATRQQVSDVWTSGRAAVSEGNLLVFDDAKMRALADQWSHRLSASGEES